MRAYIAKLAPVLDELVFVGGCTTGLFVTDPAAGGIRPTRDVDAIVDVTSYAQYTALAERLRALGLSEDATPGAPRCAHEGLAHDLHLSRQAVRGGGGGAEHPLLRL
jgi:hypothetical protein